MKILINDLINERVSFGYILREITFNTKGTRLWFFLLFLLLFCSRLFIALNAVLVAYILDGKIEGNFAKDYLNYFISIIGIVYIFVFYKFVEALSMPIIMKVSQIIDTRVEQEKVNETVDLLVNMPISSWSGVDEKLLSLKLDVKREFRKFVYVFYRNLLPSFFEFGFAFLTLIFMGVFWETMMVVLGIVTYNLVMLFLFPRFYDFFFKSATSDFSVSSIILSLFENSRLAKSYGSEKLFVDRFGEELEKESFVFRKRVSSLALAEALPSFIMVFVYTSIFFSSYSKLINGEITTGVFSAILSVTALVLSNTKGLVWAYTEIMDCLPKIYFPMACLKNCRGIQKNDDFNVDDGVGAFSGVEIKNLSVCLGGKYLLRDVSFKVSAGEKVWLVGGSGAGKTTLINVLNGFLDYEGEILVNGKTVGSKNFGFVPQSAEMLLGTVKFNLLVGNQNATEDEMWDVLSQVGLKGLVEKRGGLMALVEDGNSFSGGEKQKIAIARALLSHRNMILMDEPSSALDVDSERDLIDLIVGFKGIVLASIHRVYSIPPGSRVLFLENGILKKDGLVDDLNFDEIFKP